MARRRRRQDSRPAPPPVVAPAAPNRPEDAPAANGGPAVSNKPSNSPQISKLERCKRILVAVKETCIETILDLTILLGKCFEGLRRGVDLVNMVTYTVLIVASQIWLSGSILENTVHLMILSGIRFHFPLDSLSKFLVMGKKYLASHFRLLVLSCVCIAFVNDMFLSNLRHPPVERLKIYWNVVFAQIIMYTFIPFMNNVADIINVVLAIISFGRLGVEISLCKVDDTISSFNFLPKALLFHFLFFSILGTCFTYYEADKLLDKYWRVAPPPPIPNDQ